MNGYVRRRLVDKRRCFAAHLRQLFAKVLTRCRQGGDTLMSLEHFASGLKKFEKRSDLFVVDEFNLFDVDGYVHARRLIAFSGSFTTHVG